MRTNKRSLQVIACLFSLLLGVVFFTSCKGKNDNQIVVDNLSQIDTFSKDVNLEIDLTPITNDIGSTINTRFSPPQGFIRNEVEKESFATYLRNFPLLNSNEKVHLYNGGLKSDQSVHAAILDIDVGDRDLQQCADAIMRLRAEYLYKQKKYDDIAFNFTNGWRFEYSKWRTGNDLVVQGNNTKWKSSDDPKDSYEDFRDYLNKVFMYAGTLSLSKELDSKKLKDIEIGDIFIKGGSPGHAVLVVDLAVNEVTGDKAFILAQSYMPAQQIHVLKNPMNRNLSPWYLVSEIESELITPEWTFEIRELMRFN